MLARPPAHGEGARLTWIGHASWLVQLDGVSLLVDPVFSKSLGPGTRRHVAPALEPGTLPPIDAQLVSHNHRDHLDLPSVLAVGGPVIGGSGMARHFARSGLACTELEWWASTRVGDVTVHFVPSQHWSQRSLNDINETLWGGFVIEGSSARVYHSGDTAYFDGFSEIGLRHRHIDAALLPIGAYSPEWFMTRQHMNPEDAVRAYKDLRAHRFVAMHHATFQLTDEPREEPEARLRADWKKQALDPNACHVLPVGGSLSVRRPLNFPALAPELLTLDAPSEGVDAFLKAVERWHERTRAWLSGKEHAGVVSDRLAAILLHCLDGQRPPTESTEPYRLKVFPLPTDTQLASFDAAARRAWMVEILVWRARVDDFLDDVWDMVGEDVLDVFDCGNAAEVFSPAKAPGSSTCLACLQPLPTDHEENKRHYHECPIRRLWLADDRAAGMPWALKNPFEGM